MQSIPGYYYDPVKKRYFKEEKSTAPIASAWSSENVKRRKVEVQEATSVLRSLQLGKGRIKKSPVMLTSAAGGIMAREYGAAPGVTLSAASGTAPAAGTGADVPASCFASGFVEKGCVPLADARWRSDTVKHMYVSGEPTIHGLQIVYATLDERSLVAAYLPRDKNGRLHRRLVVDLGLGYRPEEISTYPQISDIKCYGNSVAFVGREPSSEIVVRGFTQSPQALGTTRTQILRCSAEGLRGTSRGGQSRLNDYQANFILPTRDTADAELYIGTSRGIVKKFREQTQMQWLAPSGPGTAHPGPFRDIFAIDLLASNGASDMLVTGGRPGALIIGDTREDYRRWPTAKHASSITHIKCVDNHHVFVSGLNNTMALYDIRMLRPNSNPSNSNPAATSRQQGRDTQVAPTRPVLTFSGYRNAAHINIGLAFERTSGIVAAAHDDGKVALYSVRSGERLTSPDIDGIQSKRGPIQALQFQTLGTDANPTLFVGLHSNVYAYSFGVQDFEDEA